MSSITSPASYPSTPSTPRPTPTGCVHQFGGGTIEQRDGRILVRGGRGDDDIKLERLADGRARLTMNGATRVFSAEESKRVTIAGGNGNDRLVADGFDGARLRGGAGDDVLHSRGACSRLIGGEGNDRLRAVGARATVHGGAGNDTVAVGGSHAKVRTGLGDDAVRVRGDRATVRTGGGDDRAVVRGDRARVGGGNGNDELRVVGDSASVRGGPDRLRQPAPQQPPTPLATTGAERVAEFVRREFGATREAVGRGPTIPARVNRDNDQIRVRGERADVFGGAGKDRVRVVGDRAHIDAGRGNDQVVSDGVGNTIVG